MDNFVGLIAFGLHGQGWVTEHHQSTAMVSRNNALVYTTPRHLACQQQVEQLQPEAEGYEEQGAKLPNNNER